MKTTDILCLSVKGHVKPLYKLLSRLRKLGVLPIKIDLLNFITPIIAKPGLGMLQ